MSTASFTSKSTGLSVAFTDTSSSSNPPITAWLWNFGDGNTSTVQNPTHVYAAAGTYTVSLTITDNGGANTSSPATQTLSVTSSGTSTGGSSVAPPTYTLKGFVDFSAWANNTVNTVSPLGELSVLSQTYAKDRLLFGGSTGGTTPSAMNLTVFSSEDATNVSQSVPADYATDILQIGAWMFTQATNGAFTADPAVFQQALLAQYGTVIQNVVVGTMTTLGGSSNVWLPDSLEFFFIQPSTSAPTLTADSRVKLWFSDASFQTQYDEYNIVFIPPLPVLDSFFQSAAQIQTALAQQTLPILMQEIQTARDVDPETLLNTETFNWIDPTNSANFIPTNWTYLIYGAAGNNIDAIKAALRTYILANTSHTEADWQKIFPDIFTSTEFILTPMWSQVAIPNQTLATGVYSPTVNSSQALNMAIETANGTGYTPEFVGNVLNVVPVPFKSMSVLAVGSPQNRGGIVEFAKRWTDYINVSTTSIDFDRMSQDTQGFCLLMAQMLKVAEYMTANSDLPVGMTRLTRNDSQGNPVLYLVANYDQVDYLMVAKSWMVAKYGQNTNTVGTIDITYNGIYANGAYQLLNQGTQMTLQFNAVNATAPNDYEILDTTITGATIGLNTGLFVGTFPTPGMYTLTLKMVDAQAKAVQRTFTFNYQQPTAGGGATTPPLVLGTPTAPTATVGQNYTGSIPISGGASPYSLSGAQTLPAGMAVSVQGSTVVLGGTPTVAGQGTFIITVQDSSGAGGGSAKTATTQFDITINPAAAPLTVSRAADYGTVLSGGSVVNTTMTVSGGTAPYQIVSYNMISGLTATISGSTITISGTVANGAGSTGNETVTVKDAAGTQVVAPVGWSAGV